MSTKSKFMIIMILTSVLGALVFGFLSFLESRNALRDASFDELKAIQTARLTQIESYFDSVFDEARVLTENPLVSDSVKDFQSAFNDLSINPPRNPAATRTDLEDYYNTVILPEKSAKLENGSATFQGYGPKTLAGQYLQDVYIRQNPNTEKDRQNLSETQGTSLYEKVHALNHNELKFICNQFDYYDMMLIDHKTGDILYTVKKETDFATNIYTGPYRGSKLGIVVDKVKNDPALHAVHMSDFEFYLPSGNIPAIFIATAIYDENELLGILGIQLTNIDVDTIMTSDKKWKDVGLKDTGETYIVGEDLLMRTTSRFIVEDFEGYLDQLKKQDVSEFDMAQIKDSNSNILVQKVDTIGVRAALRGVSDTKVFKDYRGVDVLSAYAPLTVGGHRYAILAEMDASETFAPVTHLLKRGAVTTGIFIPLAALAAIWIAGWLMRPSHIISETTRKYLEGDEDARYADSGGEWGALREDLNGILDLASKRKTDAENAQANVKTFVQQMMPSAVAERYEAGEQNIVDYEDMASIAIIQLFAPNSLTDSNDPNRSRDLYEQLDDRLTKIGDKDGVDLFNQAGMQLVAVCGLTSPMKNHADRLFRYCEIASRAIDAFNRRNGTDVTFQAGFHSGPLFGALVGTTSIGYEVWGDATPTATNLARAASVGSIVISDLAMEHIHLAEHRQPRPLETTDESLPPATILRDISK